MQLEKAARTITQIINKMEDRPLRDLSAKEEENNNHFSGDFTAILLPLFRLKRYAFDKRTLPAHLFSYAGCAALPSKSTILP